MSNPTRTVSQPLVSLQLPSTVADLLAHATSVAEAMTANPSFPNPSPTIAALDAAITDLRTAQAAVLTRAKGTVAVRDQKRAALVTLLRPPTAARRGSTRSRRWGRRRPSRACPPARRSRSGTAPSPRPGSATGASRSLCS